MLPDRVSNPGPLTYESGALPIALRGPAQKPKMQQLSSLFMTHRLIVMYAPVKFHEYIPYSLGVMARTPFTICNYDKGRLFKNKKCKSCLPCS